MGNNPCRMKYSTSGRIAVPSDYADNPGPNLYFGLNETGTDFIWGPGGGGGDAIPLTHTIFVDKYTTVPLEKQNGSIVSPFASLQAAVNLCATEPYGGNCNRILLAPLRQSGDADTYGNIDIPSQPPLEIMSFEFGQMNGLNFTGYPEWVPRNSPITIGTIKTHDLGTTLRLAGLRLAHGFDFTDSIAPESEQLTLWGCVIEEPSDYSGETLGQVWNLISSTIAGGFRWSSLTTINCNISNCELQNSGGPRVANLQSTRVNSDVSWTGDGTPIEFLCDIRSAGYLQLSLAGGGTVGQAGSTIKVDPYFKSTHLFNVPYPAVIAGSVVYVDVNPNDAEMFLLNKDQQVCWAPADDIVPAGVGGGLINVRVYDSGGGAVRLRFAFIGPLAEGALNVHVWIAG